MPNGICLTTTINGVRHSITYEEADGKEMAELPKLFSQQPDINRSSPPITVRIR